MQTIKRSDEGEYTCISSNSIGRGQASVNIRVQCKSNKNERKKVTQANYVDFSLDAPILRLTGGGIISENKRLILTCIVDAYPSVDSYEWYKNDEKLNLSPLQSSLIIDKVSKHESGIYKCLARNSLKYSNGSLIEKFDQGQTRVTVECKNFICLFYFLFTLI